MAQLAHCPECKSEVVLPEDPTPGSWGQCPACNEQFALAEAIARPLPEVKVVQPPTDFASDSSGVDAAAKDSTTIDAEQEFQSSLAKTLAGMPSIADSSTGLGGTTLSSFLREQEAAEQSPKEDEPETKAEDSSTENATPTLAELLSGGFGSDESSTEESASSEASHDDTAEKSEFAAGLLEDVAEADVAEDMEPSPQADRLKPTLSELFKFDQASTGSEESESGMDEFDPVSEEASAEHAEVGDDVPSYDYEPTVAEGSHEVTEEAVELNVETPEPERTELPSSLTDFAAKIDALSNKIGDDSKLDVPSFDFEVGDEAPVSVDAADATTVESAQDDYQAEPEHDPRLISGQPVVEPTIDSLDVPQSTARSMRDKLDFDSPLEFESNSSYAATDELDFVDQADPEQAESEVPELAEPRGVVATRRSSSPSMLRTLTGVAGGGVVGLGAGYLLLLWILHLVGRTDDPLSVAQYYPNAVKPSTFQQNAEPASDAIASAEQLAGNSDQGNSELSNSELNGDAAEVTVDPLNDTAVEPAAFNEEVATTVEPAATEPASFGEPEGEALFPWEKAEANAAIVIRGVPVYSAIEVVDLTQVGVAAKSGLLEGNFQNPENAKVVPTKGASYAKLAKLADAVTFAELAGEIRGDEPATELFPSLFATQRHCNEIAQIAGFWLGSSKRGHGGIFFSGQPDSGTQRGSVAEYSFLLPTGQKMVVLTDEPLGESLASAGSVGVVGSVIDNPAERVEGYTGSAELAIWSTQLFPVDAR